MTKFQIVLENNGVYLIEISLNFKYYKIIRGNLYRGLKKLGKIKEIRKYE